VNPLRTAALVAVLGAGAMTSLAAGCRPRRRSVAEVRAILAATPSRALDRSASGARGHLVSAAITAGPAGRWIDARLGTGLRRAGMTVSDVVSRILAGAATCAFSVLLAVTALVVAGSVPPTPLWLVLAAGAGVAGGSVMWSDASTRVERRRVALERATNDFVQLVSVGLTTDQSAEAAVRFALEVGDSEVFELFRTEIASAPLRGVTIWEAIERLGEEQGQPELGELAASVERQEVHGVSVQDTVAAIAAGMRARALDRLERDADRANADLAGPTVGFVVATVVFLSYPLAVRIGEAFGG